MSSDSTPFDTERVVSSSAELRSFLWDVARTIPLAKPFPQDEAELRRLRDLTGEFGTELEKIAANFLAAANQLRRQRKLERLLLDQYPTLPVAPERLLLRKEVLSYFPRDLRVFLDAAWRAIATLATRIEDDEDGLFKEKPLPAEAVDAAMKLVKMSRSRLEEEMVRLLVVTRHEPDIRLNSDRAGLIAGCVQALEGRIVEEIERRAAQKTPQSRSRTGKTTMADQEAAAEDNSLDELAEKIPPLDEGSDEWITNKVAARSLGVAVKTLSNRRSAGAKQKKKREAYGVHDDWCFWRKVGNGHPYYYLPRMKQNIGHLAEIFPKNKLGNLK